MVLVGGHAVHERDRWRAEADRWKERAKPGFQAQIRLELARKGLDKIRNLVDHGSADEAINIAQDYWERTRPKKGIVHGPG